MKLFEEIDCLNGFRVKKTKKDYFFFEFRMENKKIQTKTISNIQKIKLNILLNGWCLARAIQNVKVR
jgi:hypothetical protein